MPQLRLHERLQLSVVLIDGKQLARLMIEHNVGVSEYRRCTLKREDSDFFETEP